MGIWDRIKRAVIQTAENNEETAGSQRFRDTVAEANQAADRYGGINTEAGRKAAGEVYKEAGKEYAKENAAIALMAASGGAAGPVVADLATGAFVADGLYNLASGNGVQKTYNHIKNGEWSDAARSAGGDLLNLAMVYPGLRLGKSLVNGYRASGSLRNAYTSDLVAGELANPIKGGTINSITEAEKLGIPKGERSNPKSLEDPYYWGYQQWNQRYNAAVESGNMEEVQRLRDLHFKSKAPDTKFLVDGLPEHNYHGGQKGITIFLNAKDNPLYSQTKHQGYLHPKTRVGIYTSPDKSTAKNYIRPYGKNGQIYDLYINGETPYYQTYWTTVKNRLWNLNPFKNVRRFDPAIIRTNDLQTILSGYDSVNHVGGSEHVVWDGAKIKLADPITYTNDRQIIPIIKRDNFHNLDIRYKQGGILKGQNSLDTDFKDTGFLYKSLSQIPPEVNNGIPFEQGKYCVYPDGSISILGFSNITEDIKNGKYYLYNPDSESKFLRNKNTGKYFEYQPSWNTNLNLSEYEEIPRNEFHKLLPKREYIGGNNYRLNVVKRIPGLLDMIQKKANSYGVDPNLLLYRFMKEGAVDNWVRQYNTTDSINQTNFFDNVLNDRVSGFEYLGLDDAGTNLTKGLYTLKDPNVTWEPEHRINELGRRVMSVSTQNMYDALEIFAAEMAYRQKELKKRGLVGNQYVNAAYRMGMYNKKLNDPEYVTKNYTVPDYKLFNTQEVYKKGGKLITKGQNSTKLEEPIDTSRLKYLVDKVNKTSSANFVKRLKDKNRKFIINDDGTISTHLLGWEFDENGNAIVFPEVQQQGDSLVKFSFPESYYRAVEKGDTLRMNAKDADLFTKHYKLMYPEFIPNK